MSVSEKIKQSIKKSSKTNLNIILTDKQISALSSENVSKYEFLTTKDVLPEKDLLEKAALLKRFKYSPLGIELKTQTDIAKKQYIKLDDTDEFDKIIEKEKHSKSNLIYDANHSFYRFYHDRKRFDKISFKSMHFFLSDFSEDLDKLNNLNPQKESSKEKKINVYDKASKLYNDFLRIYYYKYNEL